jgi:hypothetical protein
MAGLIDSSLDELETDLRELKREVSRLEGFIQQVGAADNGALAKKHASPRSLSPPSGKRRAHRDGRESMSHRQEARSFGRRRHAQTSRDIAFSHRGHGSG